MGEVFEVVLPTMNVPISNTNPRNLIIFSKPKTGKTTLVAGLPNCLLLDLEKGSDYVSAMKIQASNIEEIKAIGKAIKEADYPYEYICIDTIN
jgi:stage III sporulation protein SpoIIIAA